MADQASANLSSQEGDEKEQKKQELNAPPKREKTEAQIERERVRRRRRRQRKRMIQGLSGEVKDILPKIEQKGSEASVQKKQDKAEIKPQNRPDETHPRPIQQQGEPGKLKEVQDAEKKQLSDETEISKEPIAPEEQQIVPTVPPEPEELPPALPETDVYPEKPLSEPQPSPQEPPSSLQPESVLTESIPPEPTSIASEPYEPEPIQQNEPKSPKTSIEPDSFQSEPPPPEPPQEKPPEPPQEELLEPQPSSGPEPLAEGEQKIDEAASLVPAPEEAQTITQINEQPVSPSYQDFTFSNTFEPSIDNPEVTPEPEQPEVMPFEPPKPQNVAPEQEDEHAEKFQEQEPPEEKPPLEPTEDQEHKTVEKVEKEELSEKKSALQMIGLQLAGLQKKLFTALGTFFKKIPHIFGGLSSRIKPRFLIGFVLLVGLGFFVYWVYSSKVYQVAITSVTDFFTPKAPPKIEIVVNENDLNNFGITSAWLFGTNVGALSDRVPSYIEMATFFGELKEPAAKGETGITAATFYGELRDQAGEVNEFVEYMHNLEKVQSLYSIDVYSMLDRTTERDKALLQYLENLKNSQEESLKIRQRIGMNIDDLQVSYNSLNPDRAQYESDFFAAMEALESEKSDLLLKGFVDISQKQTALKARVNALSKLATYYETALARLETRIEAVDKNRDALIEGIHVVDIPGANLDIIIKP